MKNLFMFLALAVSFNSFAGIDVSCLDNSTYALAKDGNINPNDKKAQFQVDVMAGGKYLFLSASGPHYLFQESEFRMVMVYDKILEEYASLDLRFSLDPYCHKNKFVLYLEDGSERNMDFLKVK